MIAFILNRKAAVLEAGFALWLLSISFRFGTYIRDEASPVAPALNVGHLVLIVLVVALHWIWRKAPKRPSWARNWGATLFATGLGGASALFIVFVPLPPLVALVVAAAAGLAAIGYWVYRAAPDTPLQDLRVPLTPP